MKKAMNTRELKKAAAELYALTLVIKEQTERADALKAMLRLYMPEDELDILGDGRVICKRVRMTTPVLDNKKLVAMLTFDDIVKCMKPILAEIKKQFPADADEMIEAVTTSVKETICIKFVG
jgi:hypothetical protein